MILVFEFNTKMLLNIAKLATIRNSYKTFF